MLISDDIGELNSNNKKLLLKMRFPFDVTIFPLYEFITIAQFAFEYSVAFMAGMLMALSAALVSLIYLISINLLFYYFY